MGILSFLKKLKATPEESLSGKSVHVNDLPLWVEKKTEKIVQANRLEEEAYRYVNMLKDKRFVMESRLGQWEKELMPQEKYKLNQLFSTGEEVMKRLIFPKENFESILFQHQQLLPVLERSIKTVEIIPHPLKDPWLSELVDLKKYADEFEGKVTLAGLSKMKALLERALLIEENSEQLKQLSKELASRREKKELIEAKRREKEIEFRPFVENAHYPAFERIREDRAALLAELESCEDIHQRFELKERIDMLEKTVGDKDFILKLDEALYRQEHYTQQAGKWRKLIEGLEEEIEAKKARKNREMELFTNLVKISLGEEVEVKG